MRRSVEAATTVLVTDAVVGTVIVWLPEVVVSTVIEMPVAPVTSPLMNAMGGRPEGVGLGDAPAGGDAFGPNRPAAAHPDAVLGASRTVVAVSKPVASFWPVAVMQTPGTMSASTAVDVRVNVVVPEKVTVRSPFGPVTMSVCPVTWTSWPDAPLRNWPPPRPGLGEGDAVFAAVAALPQATATNPATAAAKTSMRFIALRTSPY